MRIEVEAIGYPELGPEPVVGPDFVQFSQTAGGRPGPAGTGRRALPGGPVEVVQVPVRSVAAYFFQGRSTRSGMSKRIGAGTVFSM
jgi:hypothetical protein